MATGERFDQRPRRVGDLDDIEERAEHLVPRVVGGLKRADESVVALLRERPIATLCGAVAVGYILGRIFSRT